MKFGALSAAIPAVAEQNKQVKKTNFTTSLPFSRFRQASLLRKPRVDRVDIPQIMPRRQIHVPAQLIAVIKDRLHIPGKIRSIDRHATELRQEVVGGYHRVVVVNPQMFT